MERIEGQPLHAANPAFTLCSMLSTYWRRVADAVRCAQMKLNSNVAIGILVIAATVCSCNRQPPFRHQIARADRVVVSRSQNGTDQFSATLTGEAAREVIQSVTSAKRNGDTAPDFDAFTVEFLQGTNVLGTILYSRRCFWVPSEGNLEYGYEHGALTTYDTPPKNL